MATAARFRLPALLPRGLAAFKVVLLAGLTRVKGGVVSRVDSGEGGRGSPEAHHSDRSDLGTGFCSLLSSSNHLTFWLDKFDPRSEPWQNVALRREKAGPV